MNRTRQQQFVTGICCLLAAVALSRTLCSAEESPAKTCCPNACRLQAELDQIPVLRNLPKLSDLFSAECCAIVCCKKPCCETVCCKEVATNAGKCDQAACGKVACDKSGCDKVACASATCDKADCQQGACGKVACSQGACGQGNCCDKNNACPQLGVDFDLLPQPFFTFFAGDDQPLKWIGISHECGFVPGQIEACTATTAADKNACQTECRRESCNSEVKVCTQTADCPLTHACSQPANSVANSCSNACEQIAEMQAEIASLYSALEAHEALAAAKEDMFEHLLEYASENTRLKAQLEAHAEVAKLQEKLLAGFAENASLKAKLELAEQRQSMTDKAMELALENERLKTRIAQLEQGSSESQIARGAKRNRTAAKKALVK